MNVYVLACHQNASWLFALLNLKNPKSKLKYE